MPSEERIVITGATGFLGTQLVRVLLDRHPDAHLSLLVRDKKGRSGHDRVARPWCRKSAMDRVEALPADVSLPRCGLSEQDYGRLLSNATRVIHSAATVRFDQPIEEARRINVDGTRNILAFASEAHRAGHLRSLAYVGTAYVAGDRAGLVRETELSAGQGFRNTYERTKFEAETLVRTQLESIPGVILRPSIIVGDSRTGVTSSFKTLYWPLKIYAPPPVAYGARISGCRSGMWSRWTSLRRPWRGSPSRSAHMGAPSISAPVHAAVRPFRKIAERARRHSSTCPRRAT